jgi:hypothetical protein
LAPGVALAGLIHEAKAAIPAALVEMTARAAVRIAAGEATAGAVPAAVLVLMEGGLQSMVLAKVKLVTTAVLMAVAVATGAVGFVQKGAEDRPSAVTDGPTVGAASPASAGRADDVKGPYQPYAFQGEAPDEDEELKRLREEVEASQARLDEAEAIRFIRDLADHGAKFREVAKRQEEAVKELEQMGVFVQTYEPNALGRRLERLPKGLAPLYEKALGRGMFHAVSLVSITKELDANALRRVVEILRGFDDLKHVTLFWGGDDLAKRLREILPSVKVELAPGLGPRREGATPF